MRLRTNAGVRATRRFAPGSIVALNAEAVLSQGCSEQQLEDDLREHAPISDKTGNARPS